MFFCNNEGMFQENICVYRFTTIISTKKADGKHIYKPLYESFGLPMGIIKHLIHMKTRDLLCVILLNYLALAIIIKPSEGKGDKKNVLVFDW